LQGQAQVLGLKEGSARLAISILDIKLGAPHILSVETGQVVRPSFRRFSMEQGTIELPLGKWFLCPSNDFSMPSASRPSFVWAFKLKES
jgi:hypothetical protein